MSTAAAELVKGARWASADAAEVSTDAAVSKDATEASPDSTETRTDGTEVSKMLQRLAQRWETKEATRI